MASHLCLSVRFLDATYHGVGDRGESEWPPSPLRVFQALVAAAARRSSGELSDSLLSALTWMERQREPPVIVAPAAIRGSSYRLSVPNNAMDVVAKAWARGNDSNAGDASPATHRTMKAVRPMLLDSEVAHYVWRLPDGVDDEVRGHLNVLCAATESIVALGWGLDLVVAGGRRLSDDQVRELAGERWLPGTSSGSVALRVPIPGTLKDVVERHRRFLARVTADGFVAPPPLTSFEPVWYRREFDSPRRPTAAFSLLKLDGSAFRPFDSARRGLTVSGMMRNAVKVSAVSNGWTETKIASFVLGHGEENGSGHIAVGPQRFAYIPLPSIEARKDGPATAASVRRAMISTFADGCEEEVAWARRAMSGQELRDGRTAEEVAVLSLIPGSDNGVQRYTKPAAEWATVTPVVLPGYDDPKHYRRRMEREVGSEEQKRLLERLEVRMDALLRRSIVQAGFSERLANFADLEWRKSGFWPGTELAERYGVPDHLKRFPRYHVKIRWRDEQGKPVEIRGPVCLGGGRFYGVGLFAAL